MLELTSETYAGLWFWLGFMMGVFFYQTVRLIIDRCK
jgi:hypothetical protein